MTQEHDREHDREHYDEAAIAFLGALRGDGYLSPGGRDEVARPIRTWSAMIPVLDSGEHRPHHHRGRVPPPTAERNRARERSVEKSAAKATAHGA